MKRLMIMLALLLLPLSALAEPEEQAATFAAEHLPGYTFLDGVQFDETAMFLVEDDAGLTYFAGCVKDGEACHITLSTAFPAWMNVGLDTFHAGEGSMRLWTYPDEKMRKYEDEMLDIFISLEEDGTWQVWGVNNGAEVISFNWHSISLDVGFEFYGDLTIPLDITQVDWAALPCSFEAAMALMDTSSWRLINAKYTPVYAQADEHSGIVALGDAGAPVQFVSQQG